MVPSGTKSWIFTLFNLNFLRLSGPLIFFKLVDCASPEVMTSLIKSPFFTFVVM